MLGTDICRYRQDTLIVPYLKDALDAGKISRDRLHENHAHERGTAAAYGRPFVVKTSFLISLLNLLT